MARLPLAAMASGGTSFRFSRPTSLSTLNSAISSNPANGRMVSAVGLGMPHASHPPAHVSTSFHPPGSTRLPCPLNSLTWIESHLGVEQEAVQEKQSGSTNQQEDAHRKCPDLRIRALEEASRALHQCPDRLRHCGKLPCDTLRPNIWRSRGVCVEVCRLFARHPHGWTRAIGQLGKSGDHFCGVHFY